MLLIDNKIFFLFNGVTGLIGRTFDSENVKQFFLKIHFHTRILEVLFLSLTIPVEAIKLPTFIVRSSIQRMNTVIHNTLIKRYINQVRYLNQVRGSIMPHLSAYAKQRQALTQSENLLSYLLYGLKLPLKLYSQFYLYDIPFSINLQEVSC